jgi:thymidylate synthase (FAD)
MVMEFRKPKVFVLGEQIADTTEIHDYLKHLGAEKWFRENVEDSQVSDAELLSEVMSRGCYKSFGEGLNPNVTKIREGNDIHLKNVIESQHGSILEHSTVNFMFCDVSRVFTHELVRHRVGVAISQESLRYVRLTELKSFDFPRLEEELTQEEETWFREEVELVYTYLEEVQQRMTVKFNLNDEKSFAKKKKLTSRMRRLAPLGLLTNIGWSVNLRTLRHVIPLRTHKSAEEEIRMVFKEVGSICKRKYPNIFFDMEWYSDIDNNRVSSGAEMVGKMGEWRIGNRKV